MRKIYLVGSLRNPFIPELAVHLRSLGHEVFDDWYGSGPADDDNWREYELARGRPYEEAISGKAATNICAFDKANILASDTVILVLPAGRSGHMEIGFAAGAGKATYILLDAEYERWDVMYRLTDGVFRSVDVLCEKLAEPLPRFVL